MTEFKIGKKELLFGAALFLLLIIACEMTLRDIGIFLFIMVLAIALIVLVAKISSPNIFRMWEEKIKNKLNGIFETMCAVGAVLTFILMTGGVVYQSVTNLPVGRFVMGITGIAVTFVIIGFLGLYISKGVKNQICSSHTTNAPRES